MDDMWTIVLAVILLILILLFLVLVYSGLLHRIRIRTDRYPLPALQIAYKYGVGPYHNVGGIFEETSKLAPNQKCLGIYYDDPHQMPAEKLRWIVGCVLAEDTAAPDPDLLKTLKEAGYQLHQLPRAQQAVLTSFPFVNRLSIYISVYRVWPAIGKYVAEKELMPYPWMEVMSEGSRETLYVGLLDHHEHFFVSEAQKTE